MPKYTVQSPSGKTVTFDWTGDGEPTDADFDQVFQEADAQPPSADALSKAAQRSLYESDLGGDVESRIPGYIETARGFGAGAVNLLNTPGKLLGLAGVPVPELPVPEMFNPDPSVPGSGVGNALGRTIPGMLVAEAAPAGWWGTAGGGAALGGADTGTARGALTGAGAGLAMKALPMAPSLVRAGAEALQSPGGALATDVASAFGPPGVARAAAIAKLGARGVNRFGAGARSPKAVMDELQALKEAEALAAEAKAHGVNSGFKPSPAGEVPAELVSKGGAPKPPPPAPAASPTSSTGFSATPTSTPQVSFKIAPPPVKGAEKGAVAAAPKPVAKETLDAAIERLKAATSPQERGAIIKELRGGGEKNIGEKLSKLHAEARPLDAEDLAQAKEILSQAGDLDKALKLLEGLEATPAERRSLARALREASRAK